MFQLNVLDYHHLCWFAKYFFSSSSNQAYDVGDTIFLHMFAAFFGLAASRNMFFYLCFSFNPICLGVVMIELQILKRNVF